MEAPAEEAPASAGPHLVELGPVEAWKRAVASAVFVGAGLAVLAPVLAKPGFDDFPFSPYGMFAEPQDEKTTVTQAVAIVGGQPSKPFPPRFLGTDEVLQARESIRNATQNRREAAALCKRIAERVAAEPDWKAVVTGVEIRTVTYDSIPYFEDPKIAPRMNRTHARCDVP